MLLHCIAFLFLCDASCAVGFNNLQKGYHEPLVKFYTDHIVMQDDYLIYHSLGNLIVGLDIQKKQFSQSGMIEGSNEDNYGLSVLYHNQNNKSVLLHGSVDYRIDKMAFEDVEHRQLHGHIALGQGTSSLAVNLYMPETKAVPTYQSIISDGAVYDINSVALSGFDVMVDYSFLSNSNFSMHLTAKSFGGRGDRVKGFDIGSQYRTGPWSVNANILSWSNIQHKTAPMISIQYNNKQLNQHLLRSVKRDIDIVRVYKKIPAGMARQRPLVIGNGFVDAEVGSLIDSGLFQVYRINHLNLTGHKKHLGERTDVWVINDGWLHPSPSSMDFSTINKNISDHKIKTLICLLHQPNAERLFPDSLYANILENFATLSIRLNPSVKTLMLHAREIQGKLVKNNLKNTSGMYMLLYMLNNLNVDTVYIHGFTHYKTGYYYDASKRPDLPHHDDVHQWEFNKVRQLAEQGRVRFIHPNQRLLYFSN